jgi:hypothetical protein
MGSWKTGTTYQAMEIMVGCTHSTNLLCEHTGVRLDEVDSERALEEETRHAEIVRQIQGEIEERTQGAEDVVEDLASPPASEPASPASITEGFTQRRKERSAKARRRRVRAKSRS